MNGSAIKKCLEDIKKYGSVEIKDFCYKDRTFIRDITFCTHPKIYIDGPCHYCAPRIVNLRNI